MNLLLAKAAASEFKWLPEIKSDIDVLDPLISGAKKKGHSGKQHPTYFDNDEELPYWQAKDAL